MTLAKTEPTEIVRISPKEQVARATEMANELSRIVEEKRLYKEIGKKKHLYAEAWQTVVAFDNANPVTEWCQQIRDDDGTVIAYEAKVNIVKEGDVIASGIMACGLDEFPCQGQKGYGKHRAAMSSAQTWAGAKAARTKYAWVVTLAGYSGTPADEIPDQSGQNTNGKPATRRKSGAFCEKHDEERAQGGKGRKYHMVGEFFCIEGNNHLLNAAGEVVDELPDVEDDVENLFNEDEDEDSQDAILDAQGQPVEGGE